MTSRDSKAVSPKANKAASKAANKVVSNRGNSQESNRASNNRPMAARVATIRAANLNNKPCKASKMPFRNSKTLKKMLPI